MDETALNIVCEDGTSPLHLAAKSGELEVVLLLDAGAPLEAQDYTGATALHWAAANGCSEVTSVLLARGASPAASDRSGAQPLHDAAWSGHSDAAKALLRWGASTDATDDRGRTPLHCAALLSQVDIVEQLLESGAPASRKDQEGKPALELAQQALELANSLTKANLPYADTMLERATSVVELLEKTAKADKDKANAGYTTPLFIAAENGQLEVARFLLGARADMEKANIFGITPLCVAAQEGQCQVARLLLEVRADKDNKVDINNRTTPLFIAAQNGQLEVARLLLEARADKDKANINGTTPLFIAAKKGWLEVVRFLLEARADKNKANANETTPLSIAAENGQLSVVRLLLESKADKNKANITGATPVSIAAQERQLHVMQFFLEEMGMEIPQDRLELVRLLPGLAYYPSSPSPAVDRSPSPDMRVTGGLPTRTSTSQTPVFRRPVVVAYRGSTPSPSPTPQGLHTGGTGARTVTYGTSGRDRSSSPDARISSAYMNDAHSGGCEP
eukprot:s74_g9.t3